MKVGIPGEKSEIQIKEPKSSKNLLHGKVNFKHTFNRNDIGGAKHY